jgi:hypothetical protein
MLVLNFVLKQKLVKIGLKDWQKNYPTKRKVFPFYIQTFCNKSYLNELQKWNFHQKQKTRNQTNKRQSIGKKKGKKTIKMLLKQHEEQKFKLKH